GAWIARATRSFPTPLSPRISTVASVSATFSMTSRTVRALALRDRSGAYSTRYVTLRASAPEPAEPREGERGRPADGEMVFEGSPGPQVAERTWVSTGACRPSPASPRSARPGGDPPGVSGVQPASPGSASSTWESPPAGRSP